MALIACPECGEQISSAASACAKCGHPIRGGGGYDNSSDQKWHPGIAAVLSLLIPGAGQMYRRRVGAGLVWLLVVVIGYVLLIIPGLILHVICIINAATGDPNKW